MKKNKTFLWILALAALSVGARNFEQGMSVDGPLYATLSQQIARTGEWFKLDPRIPDFQPYAEHPHLGFWIQALIFKFLPQADWSARLSGHLFYVGFLFLFFGSLKKYYNERVATLAVLFLWIWAPFSNFFSTFYLDPGALFWGALFVRWTLESLKDKSIFKPLGAGVALALVFMTKGLTALAFLPIAAAVSAGVGMGSWSNLEDRKLFGRNFLRAGALFVGALVFILGIYYWGVTQSRVPDFLDIYWFRQMTSRFSGMWSWSELLGSRFWTALLRDSYYLIVLIPFFIAKSRARRSYVMSVICFVSFFMMYAPAKRVGGQYNLMLLPSLAWALALGFDEFLAKNVEAMSLQKWTGRLAVALVLVIQYLPFATHYRPVPAPTAMIRRYFELSPALPRSLLIHAVEGVAFSSSAPLAWYADVTVCYDSSALADKNASSLLLNLYPAPQPEVLSLDSKRWCVLKTDESRAIYEACN